MTNLQLQAKFAQHLLNNYSREFIRDLIGRYPPEDKKAMNIALKSADTTINYPRKRAS